MIHMFLTNFNQDNVKIFIVTVQTFLTFQTFQTLQMRNTALRFWIEE
jgi:hypothetical protein